MHDIVNGPIVSLRADAGDCLLVGEGPQADALHADLISQGVICRRETNVEAVGVAGCGLVLAVDSDPQRNRQILTRARDEGIALRHGLDCPELSTVDLPAVQSLGPARVAIVHDDKLVRDDLQLRVRAGLPWRYGSLLEWYGRVRAESDDPVFLRQALSGPTAENLLAGRAIDPVAALADIRRQHADASGEVYLIGAGPGDPDLLTQRAVRLLRTADVVLYDRLVAPAILSLLPAQCQRINVGKQKDRHPVPQDEINVLLRDLAQQGRRVARLKGGDPFIFGRGGEELDRLLEWGIPFQVVPGITAASGCAAYAGIPLTHRDHAQSCIFVTGHRRQGGMDVDFPALVRTGQTVVCYMGLHTLGPLCAGMREHGMDPDMPAALVEQGTTERQRVVVGTISDLPERVAALDVHAPTLLIVGEVVRLRDRLSWFQGREDGDGFTTPGAGRGAL